MQPHKVSLHGPLRIYIIVLEILRCRLLRLCIHVFLSEDIELPLNHRQHVWSNGTLQVTGVTKSDAGLYTCVASNAQGQSMQRTLHVTVLGKILHAFEF